MYLGRYARCTYRRQHGPAGTQVCERGVPEREPRQRDGEEEKTKMEDEEMHTRCEWCRAFTELCGGIRSVMQMTNVTAFIYRRAHS